MRDNIIKTLAAGEAITVDRSADVFNLVDAADRVTVELYRNNLPLLTASMARGTRVPVAGGFSKAVVRNDTAAPVAVEFYMLPGDIEIQITKTFDVVVTNDAGNPVPVSAVGATFTGDNMGMLSPDTLATVADTAVNAAATLQVVAAAAVGVKQREATIKNLAGNLAGIRVGDANTGAARGHELMPGESYTFDTLAALYVYNAGAAAQSVSIVTNSRA